jgi:chromosome segregation ATPase
VHILTKIFIVLVTLLAVAMVPLVATYTTNESSYRAKYREADDQRRVATTRANNAEHTLSTQRLEMQTELDAKDSVIGTLRSDQSNTRVTIESLQAQVGRLESQLAQSNANLQALLSASEVNSEMKLRFVSENYELRNELVAAERVVMEMEDQLEDAVFASTLSKRGKEKAEEERHNVEKQLDSLQLQLDSYFSKYGALASTSVVETGIAPDRALTSTVLTVSRNNNDVLVEINAGSRDGVKKGWIMTVGKDGTFLGRLQVEKVDINRSIGRVTLEDSSRGLVVPGVTVSAVQGRN